MSQTSTTKASIAKLFLSNTDKTFSTKQVANLATRSTGGAFKTVQNVLGILVSSGAIQRSESGYAYRNKRKLSRYVK